MPLPLRRGDHGDEVRDLNARLVAIGLVPIVDRPHNRFDDTTHDAVLTFQRQRGLEATGECDQPTWQALVEAGFVLGNRALYHTRPMLRGDDVADLQLRLGSLGFDAGRADGIFGPQTERAVAEFQRNAGLTSDGVAGPHTIAELLRLSARADRLHPVAQVREHEDLRNQPRELAGFRVCVGDDSTLPALVHSVARQLRDLGASVIEAHEPDWSTQARHANEFASGLYLGVIAAEENTCSLSYFATEGYVSTGGRRLAELCRHELSQRIMFESATAAGMRHPILRETRMPAVLCEIGSPEWVVNQTASVARALVRAIEAWVTEPLDP